MIASAVITARKANVIAKYTFACRYETQTLPLCSFLFSVPSVPVVKIPEN